MTIESERALALARGAEELRQSEETFNQLKTQDERWFVLRYAMGWVAVFLLPLITVAAAFIIFDHHAFSATTVKLASAALLVDLIAIFGAVWKLVLGEGPRNLAPIGSQTTEED